MPASLTHYFLGQRLLDSSPSLPFWDDTTLMQSSQVLVCPTCGEAWGRIMVEGREWLPVRAGCIKHPWLEDIGGTFIPPWRQHFRELPRGVLAYELDLRLARAEKELSCNSLS